ncbi:unnamed protein product [marine sediment metagenome]|uniref:Uncharacterized protein n=1 Tax=marine sediment metagenome TaxID=412755 RepID=X1CA56_9ZZZZ
MISLLDIDNEYIRSAGDALEVSLSLDLLDLKEGIRVVNKWDFLDRFFAYNLFRLGYIAK